jgi:outer membrane lipoprotein SlyB
MKNYVMAASMFSLLVASNVSQAGCLKGAVIGGVAGHVAGHHSVMGAVAGCAVGHHLAKEKKKQQAADHAKQKNPPNQ